MLAAELGMEPAGEGACIEDGMGRMGTEAGEGTLCGEWMNCAANAAAPAMIIDCCDADAADMRDIPCTGLFLAAMGLPARLLPPVYSVLMTQ